MSVAERVVRSVFEPTPPQSAFLKSEARIRGYGGAMGGGKSRCICEAALDYALDHPGVQILVCRQRHTSIVETTKKTMIEQVLPREIRAGEKASGGEDFVKLFNGSKINFVGLEDPERWFSAEIGVLVVDQVEECEEETILKLITRLRDRHAPSGVFNGEPVVGKILLSFNPANPGHWLQRWFILGAQRTEFGFRRGELFAENAGKPLGDAEFIFARARDNPYLPAGYVEQTIGALPEHLRRRYEDGLWEFLNDRCFFDTEALAFYEEQARELMPLVQGRTAGDVLADVTHRTGGGPRPKDRLRVVKGEGPLMVWKAPVRADAEKKRKAHRYILSVDVSSGGSYDYSAIQVIDVDAFEQVAEFQGKLDPYLLAVEVYRLGRIYNDGLVVPEVTGGWGFTIEQELKRLRYPRLFTRRVLDRLSKRWTDRTGWDTTVKTRAHMLDTLERVLRERELGLYSLRAVNELGSFVRDDQGRPAAQPGCNDDLVTSLAIGVTVAADQPRQLRELREKPYRPQFAVTGY